MISRYSFLFPLILPALVSAYQAEVNDVATSYLRASNEDESLNVSAELGLAEDQFRLWAEEHGKTYESVEEMKDRMVIWKKNDDFIEEHNSQVPPPSFTLGHNAYSDLTPEEFRKLHFLGEFSPVSPTPIDEKDEAQAKFADAESQEAVQRQLLTKMEDLPKSVDWVKEGAVTKVKNQGQCGACWAFSTTGAIEGAKFLKDGELVQLSEQHLIDCDHKDLGCKGGLMDNAFAFDEHTGGLCKEEEYPYVASSVGRKCGSSCTAVPGTVVKDFIKVPRGKVEPLMAAIAITPVSIALQATQLHFQLYKSGVFANDKCGADGKVDHGVLAVGYGTDEKTGEPYWLVKNSWGAGWGEHGYIRLSRNSNNMFGMCNILRLCSYPVLA